MVMASEPRLRLRNSLPFPVNYLYFQDSLSVSQKFLLLLKEQLPNGTRCRPSGRGSSVSAELNSFKSAKTKHDVPLVGYVFEQKFKPIEAQHHQSSKK